GYIRIPAPGPATMVAATSQVGAPKWEHRKRVLAPVSINSADSAAWVALPGIGATLAGRILRFRSRLGGFTSIDQVGETWGLPDSSFQKIRPYLIFSSADRLRKVNLNSASLEELRAHPYIRWNLAKVIIEYRKRHGPFQSFADLRKIEILPDSVFQRVHPYLTIN
ncbi:MAG: helix-hairpin-helix domain-containing protein, partial [Chitinophagaceae bacterium]